MPKSLAINVALLPPDDVMKKCREINARLWQKTKQGFRLDETHLPHISLVQQYIAAASLANVCSAIEQEIRNRPPLILHVFEIHPHTLEDGLVISGLNITPTPEIVNLHERLTRTAASYITEGDQSSFYGFEAEPIRAGSIQWTRDYPQKKTYNPHLTLGVGVSTDIEVPFTFTASRLAVCHIGNFNTCRKILKEWRFQTTPTSG
ncbi:MAG: hypothetical protein HY420_02480 [Candidatus Kerfeldbacteria bacterium]|nr:hypothetical protein [Candidatus Kerfeldbacteria bacterium]